VAVQISDKDLLRRLVSYDSTSTESNLPIGEFVCDYLDRPGIEVTRNHSADLSKLNVIARLGPEPDDEREGLVLCGHLDVVPATEPEWTSDPFRLEERDGCYFGRGTCDMKGFNAIAMNAFTAVDRRHMKRPLVAIFTFDEELGSLGAQRLAATWPEEQPLPRACVIGEPTSLRVVRMHKGHLTMRLRHTGQSAHSGSPHLGRNAIEPMGAVIAALSKLRAELAKRRPRTSKHFPEVPYVALNIATVSGGTARNVIPDECVVELGIRLLPGGKAETMAARVAKTVKTAAGEHEVEVEVLNDNPAMLVGEDAPIYRELCKLVEQDESVGVSYASDGGTLQRELGMDCVLYGPGTIEVAHRPDEFVPIDELQEARGTLEALIRQRCVE
jgi:acetylornithine deacetylase